VDSSLRLNQMIIKLRKQGFRLTPQRLAILKILASSEEHLSVEKIYERVIRDYPVTSLATIYKTVAVLKKIGEVMELGFVDESNRYDGARPYPHPHLVCTKCKRIIDPDLPALSELPHELARKTGYQIIHHRLDFFGLCPECQGKEQVKS
jgi:Fur family transcriptional regulator, peroxide stress response regulator